MTACGTGADQIVGARTAGSAKIAASEKTAAGAVQGAHVSTSRIAAGGAVLIGPGSSSASVGGRRAETVFARAGPGVSGLADAGFGVFDATVLASRTRGRTVSASVDGSDAATVSARVANAAFAWVGVASGALAELNRQAVVCAWVAGSAAESASARVANAAFAWVGAASGALIVWPRQVARCVSAVGSVVANACARAVRDVFASRIGFVPVRGQPSVASTA